LKKIKNSSMTELQDYLDHNSQEKIVPHLLRRWIQFAPVPEGSFWMGGDPALDPFAQANEQPRHRQRSNAFWMATTPIVQAAFAQFVARTGYRTLAEVESRGIVFEDGAWTDKPGASWRSSLDSAVDQIPVTQVTWIDARQFCDWATGILTQPGYEICLPSELEWEYAARGGNGFIYPWGSQPADRTRCNYDGQIGSPSPVQRYGGRGSSLCACLDMAGNVWEWTRSTYRAYPYHPGDGRENLESDEYRVIRGGGWDSPAVMLRCSARAKQPPAFRASNLGFRVVLKKIDPDSPATGGTVNA